MPGLFGCIRVGDVGGFPRPWAAQLLDRMAGELRHEPEYRTDVWIDAERGLAVGRIGLPFVETTRWPPEEELDVPATRTFIAGALVEPPPDMAGRPGDDTGLRVAAGARGFFAVLQSAADGAITLATDRRASVPVVYTLVDDVLYFAPEVHALVPCLERPDRLDSGALAIFLGAGHLLAHQTFLEPIRRLRGGEALVVRGGQLRRHDYWRFQPGQHADRDDPGALTEELERLVLRSVERHLGEPGHCRIFLSGGADSRAVLAGAFAATGHWAGKLHAVTWGTDPSVAGSDAAVAIRVARQLGVRHRFFARSTDDYAIGFVETNAAIDGLSDIAAFHHGELTIMRALRAGGARRVLRGDEAFGWQKRVYDLDGALGEVGLRPFRALDFPPGLLLDAGYDRLADAGDEALASVRAEAAGLEPNDAKDFLYFTHRIQGYLNTAVYFKTLLLDHRNPLLDEEILDFMARVPAELRIRKRLFLRVVDRLNRGLGCSGFAGTASLEDWGEELSRDGSVRRFVLTQLSDRSSPVWRIFDRDRFEVLLESCGPPAAPSRFGGAVRLGKKTAAFLAPRAVARIRTRHGARLLPRDFLLMRVLVLKDRLDALAAPRPRWPAPPARSWSSAPGRPTG